MSIFDITLTLKDEDGLIVHEEEFDLVEENITSLIDLLDRVDSIFHTDFLIPEIVNTHGYVFDDAIFQYIRLAKATSIIEAEKEYIRFVK